MSNKNQPSKIIFFGTSAFAEVILDKLLEIGCPDRDPLREKLEIVIVITQPDKPVGRKKIFTSPLVKILAEKNNIFVLQPEKFDGEFIAELKKLNPDIGITAEYGKIIPQSVLDIPKHKCINIHPSLLPKYRGPSPIQTALLNGDKKTGVTIMEMDDKMDHGKIISNLEFSISNSDTYYTLSKKLAEESANLLIKIIPDYISGKIKLIEQNHKKATFTKIINKQDGLIDWNKTATEIYNQWRAFIEWPGVFTEALKHIRKIKLLEIKVYEEKIGNKDIGIGEFFVENKKLLAKCGRETYLEIIKLQPEGKNVLNAWDFINGYLIKT